MINYFLLIRRKFGIIGDTLNTGGGAPERLVMVGGLPFKG